MAHIATEMNVFYLITGNAFHLHATFLCTKRQIENISLVWGRKYLKPLKTIFKITMCELPCFCATIACTDTIIIVKTETKNLLFFQFK